MKELLKNILAGFCMLLCACASNQAEQPAVDQFYKPEQLGDFLSESAEDESSEYIISIGDKLDVVFLYHTELTTIDLIVRSDGRISLPYVGDVMAAGYRPMYLDSVLTEHFSEILREPNLSVIVRSQAEKLVYVLGEVKQAGGYPFSDKVSLLQALALAGGVRTSGKPDHTVVIRREGASSIVGVEVDVKAIMRGEAIQNDFLLRNNDIVYVPRKKIESVAEFMGTVTKILMPPIQFYLKGWEMRTAEANYKFYRNWEKRFLTNTE